MDKNWYTNESVSWSLSFFYPDFLEDLKKQEQKKDWHQKTKKRLTPDNHDTTTPPPRHHHPQVTYSRTRCRVRAYTCILTCEFTKFANRGGSSMLTSSRTACIRFTSSFLKVLSYNNNPLSLHPSALWTNHLGLQEGALGSYWKRAKSTGWSCCDQLVWRRGGAPHTQYFWV